MQISSPRIIEWYSHYLNHQSIETEIKGITTTRKLTCGTSQGGILSPLVWNLAFDGLLNKFDQGPAHVKGFADDAALILKGHDPYTLISQGQEALNKALTFGIKTELEFGASKTEVVFFTRKRLKLEGLPRLSMNNKPLEYSNQVKYLGIILNIVDHSSDLSKLTFGPHIKEKSKKAIKLLYSSKNSVRQLWGPVPSVMKWIYTGIVRPKVSYGAIVWASCSTYYKRQLDHVQRLGIVGMAHIRCTTPIEAVLDIMPLNLHEQCMAVQAALQVHGRNRVKWDGIGEGCLRGHVFWGERHLERAGLKNTQLDLCQGTNWVKNYKIDLSSFTDGSPLEGDHVECFTDRSLLKKASGWGYIMNDQGIGCEGHGSLGHRSSVFQAEVTAIIKAARALLPVKGREILFFIDSQAALHALNAIAFNSILVRQCMDALNTPSKTNSVTLRWVKAHMGHKLNEEADDLAKCGTGSDTIFPPPIPRSLSKQLVKKIFTTKWMEHWKDIPMCWQTKYWIQTPGSLPHWVIRLSRSMLSLILQALTGHNYLNYHKKTVGNIHSDRSRYCRDKCEEFYHLTRKCDALAWERLDSFRELQLPDCPPDLTGLVRFIHVNHIGMALGRRIQ